MVDNGRWVITDEDIRRQKKDAVYEEREAERQLEHLLTAGDEAGTKLMRVATLFRDIRNTTDWLRGPAAAILQLPRREYEELVNFEGMRALAEEMIRAEKTLREARDRVRKLGA